MATFKIGVPNLTESALCVVAGGSFVANANGTAGLDNILGHDMGVPAISTNAVATSTEFRVDMSALATLRGTTPGADALMIPKHNLTQAATIRVRAGTAAFTTGGGGGGTILYDSGTVLALKAIVYAPGLLPWGHDNTWTGAPDPLMDIGAYNRAVLVQFGTTVVAKYWHVQITDTANPDGVVKLYRVMIAPFWQPPKNFDYGVTIEPVGTRVADESMNNAEFPDPNRLLKRLVTFQISDVPIEEATAVWLPIMLYLRYDRQAIFVFDPADVYDMERRAFCVTQYKPGALAYANYNTNNVPLQLIEAI